MPSFLDTPLIATRHIGIKYAKKLERLHLQTIRDLLWHFPNRYEDFSRLSPVSDLAAGEQATIQGIVETIDVRRSFRKRMIIVEAYIRDESGLVRAIWFNQPYLKNTLLPGRVVNISGKVSEEAGEVYFSHPAHEIVDRQTVREHGVETRHTGRLIPIYPETHGLTSRTLRFLIQPLLKNLPPLDEWIPDEVLKKTRLPSLSTALKHIHFPHLIEDAELARQRFAFENLFLLQLFNTEQKEKLHKEKAPVITVPIPEIKRILKELPFPLTTSQKKSLWEVVQDFERGVPMNRLLQGDVGSGKTVVAALSALFTARSGYQTAILAPTEILAQQHFKTFRKLFSTIPSEDQPTLGLLTAHRATVLYETDLEKELTKEKAKEYLKNQTFQIVIGTHALLEKGMKFNNLGLVIIDEQHRFGVAQRATLLRKEGLLPHFLSMSATPIPRTLTLTIFGDLDLSSITELPAGRKIIQTQIITPPQRTEGYALIRREIQSGRQAFVVCPRISPSETETLNFQDRQKLEVRSVTEEYERLRTQIFPDLRIAMLHGQMKPKEKESIMAQFQSGEIDIVVSTSVIEVGVDVPNATVMAIEGSDRFGLAQLYQFRGRVGRGAHQSYCLLFTDTPGPTAKERLKAIVEAKNGFELAEKDLVLRGPGQFLGKEQTGFPDELMRGLSNPKLLLLSRKMAQTITKRGDWMSHYPLLQNRLELFKRQIHQE